MTLVRRDAATQITASVRRAIEGAMGAGEMPSMDIPGIELEIPKEKTHGDYATNIAMKLARPAKKAPRAVAEMIAARFERNNVVERIEVAGPGFINFHLGRAWLRAAVRATLDNKQNYGCVPDGGGRRVLLEYVSANPTGPLHVGHGRGAAVGSSLEHILRAAGFDVQTEFYINDAGNQIANFARSLEARYFQRLGRDVAVPEDGYHGEDLIELASRYIDENGDALSGQSEEQRRAELVKFALRHNLARLRRDLESFGVVFDSWFSEQTIHDAGEVARAVKRLGHRGYTYEHEGALWFRSTDLGDDKDRVMIRANELPTYMAVDIAYHENKLDRGFDELINIWGADHHGYIARMKAAIQALGHDPEKLRVIIVQMVTLLLGGQPLVMSKRTGQLVTLSELIDEVGRDAARFFFIMRSSDSQFEFDLDLAKAQSNDNPVYYVQYAHARVASILRQAAELGYAVNDDSDEYVDRLVEEAEVDLIKRISEFPEEVAGSALSLGPHRLSRYLLELAGMFHSYYNAHRILVEDPPLRNARIMLARSAGITIRRGLELLGLSAPERM